MSHPSNVLLRKSDLKRKSYGLDDFVFQRAFYGFSKLKMKKLFQRKFRKQNDVIKFTPGVLFRKRMYPKINLVQYFERCRKCEANSRGPLFKSGVEKHLKASTHECKIGSKRKILLLVSVIF